MDYVLTKDATASQNIDWTRYPNFRTYARRRSCSGTSFDWSRSDAIGVISTPGVAYLTKALGAQAGVMISASHNPVGDNGIKFFGPDGFKLSDGQEHEIEDLLDQTVDGFLVQLAQT